MLRRFTIETLLQSPMYIEVKSAKKCSWSNEGLSTNSLPLQGARLLSQFTFDWLGRLGHGTGLSGPCTFSVPRIAAMNWWEEAIEAFEALLKPP